MSLRALCPELEEIARRELNEDPARVAGDIQHLKDWIDKQPHLKARTDDQLLLAFLRGCKFSLERAKGKIDLYYTLRSMAPELTMGIKLSHPRFAEFLDTIPIFLLKRAGPDQPRVMIMRIGDFDPTKITMFEFMSTFYLLHQITLYEDDVLTVAGVHSILDMEGATMTHFAALTPTIMKTMMAMGQDASPVRMKSNHYINTPPGFETVFNLIKTFMNEKNKSRLYVHNKNYEEMYKYIPKDILPKEYGGSAGTVAEIRDYWKKVILEHAEFLKEEEQYCTDESKRVGKPRTAEDMFGVEGSFRQLQVD